VAIVNISNILNPKLISKLNIDDNNVYRFKILNKNIALATSF
jgi:hypothetical protein